MDHSQVRPTPRRRPRRVSISPIFRIQGFITALSDGHFSLYGKLIHMHTGLDFKACTWLRDFLPIFPKIAVRQTVGGRGRGAAEGNSK